MKATFMEKQNVVLDGIKRELGREGVDFSQVDENALISLAKAYMLVEQCLWYRLENDAKVDTLLVKFQDVTSKVLELLKVYNFDDVVYTFRKHYTNLFEVQGKGRKYNLSSKDYHEFIANIENKSIQVLNKPSKNVVKKQVSSTPQTTKDSFLSNLLDKATNVQPKVVAKAKTIQPKVVMDNEVVTFLKEGHKGKGIGSTYKFTLQGNVEVDGILDGVVIDNLKNYSVFIKQIQKQNHLRLIEGKDIVGVKLLVSIVKPNAKVQPKVVKDEFLANLVSPPQPKVVNKKRGGWVEHDMKANLDPKTFIKMKLKDDTTVFGRFLDVSIVNNSTMMQLDIRGTIYFIDVANVQKVYTYQR